MVEGNKKDSEIKMSELPADSSRRRYEKTTRILQRRLDGVAQKTKNRVFLQRLHTTLKSVKNKQLFIGEAGPKATKELIRKLRIYTDPNLPRPENTRWFWHPITIFGYELTSGSSLRRELKNTLIDVEKLEVDNVELLDDVLLKAEWFFDKNDATNAEKHYQKAKLLPQHAESETYIASQIRQCQLGLFYRIYEDIEAQYQSLFNEYREFFGEFRNLVHEFHVENKDKIQSSGCGIHYFPDSFDRLHYNLNKVIDNMENDPVSYPSLNTAIEKARINGLVSADLGGQLERDVRAIDPYFYENRLDILQARILTDVILNELGDMKKINLRGERDKEVIPYDKTIQFAIHVTEYLARKKMDNVADHVVAFTCLEFKKLSQFGLNETANTKFGRFYKWVQRKFDNSYLNEDKTFNNDKVAYIVSKASVNYLHAEEKRHILDSLFNQNQQVDYSKRGNVLRRMFEFVLNSLKSYFINENKWGLDDSLRGMTVKTFENYCDTKGYCFAEAAPTGKEYRFSDAHIKNHLRHKLTLGQVGEEYVNQLQAPRERDLKSLPETDGIRVMNRR